MGRFSLQSIILARASSRARACSAKAILLLACISLCLVGCEDGGKSFRKALRGAATGAGSSRGKMKPPKDAANSGKKLAGAKTDAEAPPKPKHKDAIESCPKGARLMGAPPPEGNSQWCAKKNEEGKVIRHGAFRKWHQNGELKESGLYLDNKANGTFVKKTSNGTVIEEKQFYEGKLHGAHIKYDKAGTRRSYTSYRLGEKHGEWAKWTRDGLPRERGEFYKENPHGEWYSFHRNGQIRSMTTFHNGKKHGPVEKYSKDGVLVERGEYKEDKPHDRWTTFWRDGNPKVDGVYIDGNKHGQWITYAKNGGIRKTVVYDNGAVIQQSSPSFKRARQGRSRGKAFGSRDILGAEPPRIRRPVVPRTPTRNTQEQGDSGWVPM